MYLDSINIKNYFSIDDVGIVLTDLVKEKEIYFAGENGVGKTILLQAIARAIKGNQQIGAVIDILKQNKKDAEFQATISENIDFYAYGINRLFIRNLEEIDYRNEEVYISLFDNSRNLTDPVYWLQMLELDKQHQRDNIRPDEVTGLLSELLDKEIEIRIESTGVSFIERNTELQFTQLSDGYKSAITWIADLLARLSFNQPNVRKLEDYKAVVCIDEIGIYLHPKLKFDLVKKLRSKFKSIQWIFTTHSPIVMLGASVDAVAFKIYKDNGATRISEPIELKNFTANSLITSNLWNLDFFFSREAEPEFISDIDDTYQKIYTEVQKKRNEESHVSNKDLIDLIKNKINKKYYIVDVRKIYQPSDKTDYMLDNKVLVVNENKRHILSQMKLGDKIFIYSEIENGIIAKGIVASEIDTVKDIKHGYILQLDKFTSDRGSAYPYEIKNTFIQLVEDEGENLWDGIFRDRDRIRFIL